MISLSHDNNTYTQGQHILLKTNTMEISIEKFRGIPDYESLCYLMDLLSYESRGDKTITIIELKRSYSFDRNDYDRLVNDLALYFYYNPTA